MWLDFAIQIVFLLNILYLPGIILFRLFGVDWIRSVASAPVLSMTTYYLVAYLFVMLGLQVRWHTIIICSLLLFFAASCFLIKYRRINVNEQGYLLCFVYVLISSSVATFLFVKTLDGADSIVQLYDNAHHLYLVEQFVSTGMFAPKSLFSYPSLWHSIAALSADFGGTNIAVSINALNYVVIVFILPLGFLGLLKTLWPSNSNQVLIFGSFVPLVSLSFPWNLVTFGPLFPYLFACSLVFVASFVFISLVGRSNLDCRFWANLSFFVLLLICLVCAHPSVIFTSIALLSPFLLFSILTRFKHLGRFFTGVFVAMGVACLIVLFWVTCFKSPIFSRAVNYGWQPWGTVFEAIQSILTFDLSGYGVVQPVLVVVALIGAYRLLTDGGQNAWLIVSVLFSGLLFIASVSFSGFPRKLLAGFWYNDSYRLAAIFSISIMPLLAYGLSYVNEFVSRILLSLWSSVTSSVVIMSASIAFTGFVFFFFSLMIPIEVSEGYSVSPAGLIEDRMEWCNRHDLNQAPLDWEEARFLKSVSSIVGSEPVLNFPFDGSVFGAHLYSINLVIPTMSLGTAFDPDSLEMVASSIDQYFTNEKVREAVDQLGVRYVLLLDYGRMNNHNGESFTGDGFSYSNYDPEYWAGFCELDIDNGFEVILSHNDMALIRLN